jgi:hypothetical protein
MSGFDFVVTVVAVVKQLLDSSAWLWVPLVFLLWLGTSFEASLGGLTKPS